MRRLAKISQCPKGKRYIHGIELRFGTLSREDLSMSKKGNLGTYTVMYKANSADRRENVKSSSLDSHEANLRL